VDVLEQLDDVQRGGADARRKQRLRRLHMVRVEVVTAADPLRAVVTACSARTHSDSARPPHYSTQLGLQCSDAVGWAAGRASGL